MADVAVSGELIGAALLAALEERFDGGLLPPGEPQAIIHPNGFVKLPLARTGGGGTRLFLHVWRADSADAAVHDHRWAFASAVLCGELSHTLMDVTVSSGSARSSPNGLSVARYRPEGGKHCFDTSHDETAVVNHRRTQVFSTSQCYGMDAFVFHRAHARAGAMTFVARGLPQRAYSRVLLSGEAVPPETRQWRRLDEAERRHHLRDALAALDALQELARPEAPG
ncbi:hypothetical protein ACFWZT_09675 [Streptomyces alboflavus]|uniref:hypothetical protein n=1 Tax=Streptomyces alboflavus TaxID=67267 RepID=UPI0036C64F3A